MSLLLALLSVPLLPLLALAVCLRCRLHLGGRRPAAFFHPYCNAAGGGERVLWFAVKAMLERADESVVVYTGDVGVSPAAILARAEQRFGISLPANRIEFVYLKQRWLVEPERYSRFTLLGQSLGSVLLGAEALLRRPPRVWIDTTGFAFTFPLARWAAGARVAAYVHYPTISTDMIRRVGERRQDYNNAGAISQSAAASGAKLLYYRWFAALYRLVGARCDVVLCNSSWTRAHIAQLWALPDCAVLFPPCEVAEFRALAAQGLARERVAVSLGQFRPEKDHSLQLRALALVADDFPDLRLALVGGCRDRDDEARVARLREEAAALGVADRVQFRLNVDFAEIKHWLATAAVGLHTMRDEHFGISVVEFLAAGVLTVAHNSAGPRMDIVVPGTGYLAETAEEYAQAISRALRLSDAKAAEMRRAAGEHVEKFSNEKFEEGWWGAVEGVVAA